MSSCSPRDSSNRRSLSRLCPLILAVVLATAGCGGGATSAAVAEVATFRVERRDLRVTVSEKGTLKAANQILVRPEIPGQAKIVTLVEEGTQVKEGDVVCELDRTDKTKEVEDLANRVIVLDGEVKAAQAEIEIQLSQNSADIRDAALEKRFAEVELERFEKGEYVQERKQREVRVEAAKSELERAAKRYDQMPGLKEEGFVTAEQVEEERIRKVKAESELQLATLDLDSYLKYSHPKDSERKQADVYNAALEVERTTKRAEARETQKRADVDRRKSELLNVSKSLATARTVLEKMTIKAPGPGIVIYGDARNPWEDRQIKVGESVYAGQPFLTLPDLSEMQALVAIHEADISRIRPGQKAYVTVESANESAVEGEVVRVAPVAASAGRRWSEDTKRFNVEVALRGDITALKLKPGLTARVEILVGELKGVLAVPAQAVFAERGKFYVFRRSGGAVSRAEVEIEDGSAQFTVVKSGLAEGDELLLYNPYATEGGAPAAAAPEGKAASPAAPGAQPAPGGSSGGAAGGKRSGRSKP